VVSGKTGLVLRSREEGLPNGGTAGADGNFIAFRLQRGLCKLASRLVTRKEGVVLPAHWQGVSSTTSNPLSAAGL